MYSIQFSMMRKLSSSSSIKRKENKLSSKRPPPVLKRTSLTSSRVFVRVSNRKREREGEGKRGCSAKNEEAKQTAARKRMNE